MCIAHASPNKTQEQIHTELTWGVKGTLPRDRQILLDLEHVDAKDNGILWQVDVPIEQPLHFYNPHRSTAEYQLLGSIDLWSPRRGGAFTTSLAICSWDAIYACAGMIKLASTQPGEKMQSPPSTPADGHACRMCTHWPQNHYPHSD